MLLQLKYYRCFLKTGIPFVKMYPIFLDQTPCFETGTHVGNFISDHGCDSIVTLDLTVVENKLDFDIQSSDPGCLGEENGSIELWNINNGAPPITYFFERRKYI